MMAARLDRLAGPAMAPADQIESMRQVVRLYLPPDSGITPEECLNKLIEMLDGPGVFILEEGTSADQSLR